MSPLEIILGVATLLSIASGIYFANRSATRDKKKDDQSEASQMSLVMFKLDNIDSTVKDIKADFKSQRADMQDARERILVLERDTKAMSEKMIHLEQIIDKETGING